MQKYDIMIDVRKIFRKNEQNREAIRQEEAALLTARLHPHFLFNSITGIRGLCAEDPALAKEALGSFAVYLRGCLDSLTEEGLIPFSKEMERVESYLALSRLRYEDRLRVTYDLQEKDFKLPARTVMTLVECAVKCGVNGNADGTMITVSARSDDTNIVIKVSDDGPGIDPAEHEGIKDIQDRMDKLCGGTLIFENQRDVGTTVTVVIPNNYGEQGAYENTGSR